MVISAMVAILSSRSCSCYEGKEVEVKLSDEA
jgi:hypothetical protein